MPRITRGREVKQPVLPTRLWNAFINDYVQALCWSPDGSRLAAAAIGGSIYILDASNGEICHQLPGHGFGTSALSWNPTNALLASAGQDGHVRMWDTEAGTEQHSLAGGAAWVEAVAWHPNGNYLASAAGRKVRLWSNQGSLLHDWSDHPSTVADIAWHPAGHTLAAATYGGLTLWCPGNNEPQRRYEWKGSTLVIAWSPDGKVIATGDQDSTVHFWYLASGKDLQMWGYPTKVRELAWDSTSRYLATGGGENITVWDCNGPKGPEGTRPIELTLHELLVSVLAYQHRRPVLASGGRDGRVIVWTPSRSRHPQAVSGFNSVITQLVWSGDDQRLAIGTDEGQIAVMTLPPSL